MKRFVSQRRIGDTRRLVCPVMLDVRRPLRHGVICCMGSAFGLGHRASQTLGFSNGFPKIPQAPVTERCLTMLRLLDVRARPFGCFRLNLADCLLQRQALARNVRLVERRHDTAQLGHQRSARAVIQGAAILAGVLVQAANRALDQGIIVSHRPYCA